MAALRAVKPDAQVGRRRIEGKARARTGRAERAGALRILIVKLSSLGDVVHAHAGGARHPRGLSAAR